jgi:hypothetical protein
MFELMLSLPLQRNRRPRVQTRSAGNGYENDNRMPTGEEGVSSCPTAAHAVIIVQRRSMPRRGRLQERLGELTGMRTWVVSLLSGPFTGMLIQGADGGPLRRRNQQGGKHGSLAPSATRP